MHYFRSNKLLVVCIVIIKSIIEENETFLQFAANFITSNEKKNLNNDHVIENQKTRNSDVREIWNE